MRNICMIVSYDGTSYSGFQTQVNQETIQDVIEDKLQRITGEKIKIISSGRTDAGVHARAQVFNFHTNSSIPTKRWCLAINDWLPKDIVVRAAYDVPLDFHARKWAKSKTYVYSINNHRYKDVFKQKYQLHYPTFLNTDEMKLALEHIVGEHDFTSFCSLKSDKSSHIRTIQRADLEVYNPSEFENRIDITITGNGFLRQMVRIIVGTLIEIGAGKRKSEDMKIILAAKDRLKAGSTALSDGLTLWEVHYKVSEMKML
ncbi:tRNA pseudouridine(38-40) synthase TruA [Chengkuizengella axinellae]|uniref:tRNA pseudouridine synthase A n=1 Tax=Chengkuizengella axinellae TaxID=3064388 RepID=A0ABT9J5L1_9BACL|nr:tRNA pseudouridine(38-40) synthase TruA [Chengkuizengella sp. 2205SS18-9]MDP5276911.1 tRNA pseudouridine(38-40) synthase TruA [Chengkuizengella sp. 2205SS18-9]